MTSAIDGGRINYPHLAGRLFNRPLLVSQQKAEILVGALMPRLGREMAIEVPYARGGRAERLPSGLLELKAASDPARRSARKVYQVADGVAVVPVMGTLVQRHGLDPESGMTGYDGLRVKIREAADDADVRGILLDIDSPGGEVAGVADLADEIAAVNAVKPVWAALNETAASAAYWLAAAAERITVPRTGQAGSIGVLLMHVDMSRAAEAGGLTVTLIHAGAHKVDGNPYAPLPDDVRADLQAEIDAVYDLFTAAVARGRGLDQSAVMATEARVYMGDQAVDMGLADAVAAFDETLVEFQDYLGGAPGGNIAAGVAASGIVGAAGNERAAARGPATAMEVDEMASEKTTAAAVQPEITLEAVKSGHPKIAEALRAEGREAAESDIEERLASAREQAATEERHRILEIGRAHV